MVARDVKQICITETQLKSFHHEVNIDNFNHKTFDCQQSRATHLKDFSISETHTEPRVQNT